MAEYTFIGPDADRRLLKGLRAYTTPSNYTMTPPEEMVSAAGAVNAPQPTAGGYPNYGSSTTPTITPTGLKSRVAPLNLPTPGVDAAVLSAAQEPTNRGVLNSDARPSLGLTRPEVVQPGAAPSTPIPVGKFGWKGTSEALRPGQPTLIFGTPGQDGGGIGSWRPGSGQRVAGPAAATARFTPQAPAPAFAQPVKSPLEISMENLDRINASRPNAAPGDQPQYLGPESGLGWKTRLGLYKEQMDANIAGLNRENNLAVAGINRGTALDAAGLRALVDREQIAAGAGLREAQAAEATSKATAGLRLTAAADALKAAQPGTAQHNAALRDYLVLSGQGGALAKDPKEYIQKVVSKRDQLGTPIEEKVIRIDPTTNTSVDIQDVTPGAQLRKEFDAQTTANPARAKEYAKLKETNPAQYEALFQQFAASKQQGGK